MSRFIVSLVAFTILMISAGAAEPGDISSDGIFSSADISLLSDHLIGSSLLTDSQLKTSDVNADGKVDIADVVLMVKWSYRPITINTRPDSGGWTLTGPAEFYPINGSGDRLWVKTIQNAPIGTYTLMCWDDLPNYDPPAEQTKILPRAGRLDFDATWTLEAGKLQPVEMITVTSGTFTMGRTDYGDDAVYGQANELPRHQVTLSTYQISKYEVTYADYCKVMTYAAARGYLDCPAGWWGPNEPARPFGWRANLIDFYPPERPYGSPGLPSVPYLLLYNKDEHGNRAIEYRNNAFVPIVKQSYTGSYYPLDTFPVGYVSWYGAVAYCNWLSERNGYMPCYDLNTMELKKPCPNGYRLPTEAEWERAAAWSGTRHWIYGFQSDALSFARCNTVILINGVWEVCDPLGFKEYPFFDLSPVGWFNGSHFSPNRWISTVDSPSPVGCYDMSGNVREWCQDWYGEYSASAVTNPSGPATGEKFGYCKVGRGTRTAYRRGDPAAATSVGLGFRVARTP